MISMYSFFIMSVHFLQNPNESVNYFRETQSIRTLILINFMDKKIIKTVWENSMKQKWSSCDFRYIKSISGINF